MMGSRGYKGAEECDALSHKFRRRVCMPPRMIRRSKRRFWRRTRKEVHRLALIEAHDG
jgi:hypothetical protein